MTPKSKEKWEYVAERWGFPIAALAVLVTAMGVGIHWFAGNIAEPMVANHQMFLQSQCEISRQQAETLKEVRGIVQKVADCEEKQATSLDATLQVARENNEMLKQVQEVHDNQITLLRDMIDKNKTPRGGGG